MTGLKTLTIVKCITIWNYLVSLYNVTSDKCQNIYYYLKDYFYGYHDMWLFVPGHTFPLQLSNLCNKIHIYWMYDNYTNTLRTPANDNQIKCKLSWLSAKICVQDPSTPEATLEYEIDDFIEKFSVHTKSTTAPSLYIIFMCWCACTKHWFKTEDIIKFHIIDDMGEEIVLDLIENNDALSIKRNKLYIVDNKDGNQNVVKDIPTKEISLKEVQQKKDE